MDRKMMKKKIKSCIPVSILGFYGYMKDVVKNGSPKKKHKKNSNIQKVAFIIQFPETWNSCRTVYEEFLKNGVDAKIICIPKFAMDNPETVKRPLSCRENEAYEYFSGNGCTDIIRADKEDNTWYDVDDFAPDLIFYTRPYNFHYPVCYRSGSLKKYVLCYIPYGYYALVGSVLNGGYNADFIRNITYSFMCNRSSTRYFDKYLLMYRVFGSLKLVDIGYPRFDILKGRKKHSDIITITWLPRWTVPDNVYQEQKTSHFIDYYRDFLYYASHHTNMRFVIRPHPLMFDNYVKAGLMTEKDVESFIEDCQLAGNITLDCEPDYLPLIDETDILVTDYTSLMVEFFLSDIPVVYCDNTRNFCREAREMLDAMYKAECWEDIEKSIMSVIDGNDIYAENRKKIILNMMKKTSGSAGKKIVNYLLKNKQHGDDASEQQQS